MKPELIDEIMEWGREKNISNSEKQLDKLLEETRETATALESYEMAKMFFVVASGQTEDWAKEAMNVKHHHLIEELGDIGIVWLQLCRILEIDPECALQTAHDKNKIRTGKTINGNFIKAEDLL